MAKLIEIPFLASFKDAMLSGKKTMTSRFRRYGQSGDRFHIFNASFEIIGVQKMKLGDVAEYAYEAEGFVSKKEFKKVWRKIHPQRYENNLEVWAHSFKRV